MATGDGYIDAHMQIDRATERERDLVRTAQLRQAAFLARAGSSERKATEEERTCFQA